MQVFVIRGIRINRYQNPRVPKLRYAVNDAQAVERALLAQGFRQDPIFTLTDDKGTKAGIEQLLGDELRQQLGANDRLLVFFASHGKTDQLRSGEEEGYLVPVDGDPNQLFSTAISMSALRQISDRLAAKHILYIVDACYSGYAIYNRSIADDLLEEMIKKPAIQILTAGRQQDEAQERAGHRGVHGGPGPGLVRRRLFTAHFPRRYVAECHSHLRDVPLAEQLFDGSEFYGKDMPLGGLEFAIVKIIEALATEGCEIRSLGGTYGCRLEVSPHADPEVDRVLDDLHKQNMFKRRRQSSIQEQVSPAEQHHLSLPPHGSGRADNVIDIIMMIADPASSQTSDEENHNAGQKPPVADTRIADESALTNDVSDAPAQRIDADAGSRALQDVGFNPMTVPGDRIEHDSGADPGSTPTETRRVA